MPIKKLGVWAVLDSFTAAQAAQFARRLDGQGYGAIWIPEALGREAFSSASWLLAQTQEMSVATGIANIYARDAFAAAAAQKTLNEQSNGRFLLGLGVSHVPLVESRHHAYGKPIETMRTYLDGMQRAHYRAPAPAAILPTVVAALGPNMLALSRDHADGAHPYNVPPEHTHRAREILGAGKLLCVEQAAVLETDAARARATARQFLSIYLTLPNYVNNWKRLGFSDADVAGGGSDRFVDAIVAWGDEQAVRRRIDAHFAAGADHVCVQALDREGGPDVRLLDLLAPRPLKT